MLMIQTIYTDPGEDGPPPQCPEKGLIAGVINQAFSDACEKTYSTQNGTVARDAVDFLMSSRSDPYFEFLDIDPDAAREALVQKTAYRPEYAKFRYWLRCWRGGFRFSDGGKILAGRQAA